jgi:hypothetical protein
VCKNGVCVRGGLVEANSTECGYVKPVPYTAERRRPPCGNYGDVDGDGYITEKDIQMVVDYSVGKIALTPEQLKRADVRGDGVTYKTPQLIKRYLTGAIDTFPVCVSKPECAEGDKKPGYICSEGKWVPYAPEVTEKRRLYVKFAIPWLDMLPGIPYEPWMIIPPGFKVIEEP